MRSRFCLLFVSAFLSVALPSSALAVCGDDVVEGGEECDDGNVVDGDGCSSACVIEPATGRECQITFSVTSATTHGAIQFLTDYAGVGQFRGTGSGVDCALLAPNSISAGNDFDSVLELRLAIVGLSDFTGPIALWRCTLDLQSELDDNPMPGDFPITIEDATDPNGTPIDTDVAVTDIDCDTDGTFCGDGIVQAWEECDDSNSSPADGCSGCSIETCFSCDVPVLPGPSVCTQVAVDTPCDDGNACTDGDTCDSGAECLAGPPLDCDNDDACDGTETCNPVSGCVPGTPLDCDDGSSCTIDTCDPDNGCESVPNGNVCCDVTFRLTSASDGVGALQFQASYADAGGGIEGSGAGASCVNLIPGTIFAANDEDALQRVNLGSVYVLQPLDAPADVVECGYFATDGLPPSASEFDISVIDSSDEFGAAITATVSVGGISCPDFDPCPVAPELGCFGATSSAILVRDSSNDEKDQLKWKWKKGDAFEINAISNPTSDGLYALCLYPDGGNALDSIVLSSGANWDTIGDDGYKYKDKTASSGGVKALQLKSGVVGATRSSVVAKGLQLPANLLPAGQTYTFQLRDVINDLCWSSSFANGETKGETYKAKTP